MNKEEMLGLVEGMISNLQDIKAYLKADMLQTAYDFSDGIVNDSESLRESLEEII